MATKRYKKILLIRFIGYFATFLGSTIISFGLGPVVSSEFKYRYDQLFGIQHRLAPTVITSEGQQSDDFSQDSGQSSQSFGEVNTPSDNLIRPVSTDYGIVIEKINANAKIVADVDPGNEQEYSQALFKGVAAAEGSTNPGEPGNLYIFSHSVDAPWNIVRFNAVFYLLRELNKGDKISIFYTGKRYDYGVFDKKITSPSDISFLTNRYDKPVLTLQTCDPPGTLLNRLVVRAQLIGS